MSSSTVFDKAKYFRLAQGGGRFASDYKSQLAAALPSIYHVQHSWENYDRLSKLLDQRFSEWRANRK